MIDPEFVSEYLGYIICGGVLLLTILIAIVAQVKVHSAYNKYSKVASPLDMTGAELARKLAMQENVSVSVKSCSGNLSDHFNPSDNSLNISDANYNGKSISAHAIVAHEFGHAMQKAENYFPYKIRQATVKISNFMSKLLLPMVIIGVLFNVFWIAGVGEILIYAYIGLYSASFIVSLVTLPVEYNASKRAKVALQSLGVTGTEQDGVCDVLNSAALTYVASMLVNLAYLLRFLALLRLFRRD